MWKNGNAHTVGKVQIETNPLEKYPGICGIKMHTYSLTQPIQLLGNNLNKSAYIYKIHVKKATGGGEEIYRITIWNNQWSEAIHASKNRMGK